MFRPGIEAFSLVMFLNVTKAFPQAAVVGDVFTLLNHIKQFFDLRPVHDEQAGSFKLYNDDLAGFFTSIPSDRFEKAFRVTWQRYLEVNPGHAERVTITPEEQEQFRKMFGGVRRPKSRARDHIDIVFKCSDLIKCMRIILSMNFFRLGVLTFRQIIGALMGSPASPILCAMVVAVTEQAWAHAHATLARQNLSTWFLVRCVDNRLIFLPDRAKLPAF